VGGGVFVGESEADGKGLEIRRGIPLVAGDTAVKNSKTGTDCGFAITEGVPGHPHPRRNVAPAHRYNPTSDLRISREQYSCGRCGPHRGMGASDVRRFLVLWIRGWRLHVPAHSQVECEAMVNPEIVLRKQCRVPGVGEAETWRVLRERTWKPKLEVRQRVLADHSVERKDAVVVEQRLLDVFVE